MPQITIKQIPGIRVKLDSAGIARIERNLGDGLGALTELKQEVRKYIEVAHARAVRNVSGTQVSFKGGTFVINRQTGTLARRFRVVYPNPMSATLVNEAEYASYVNDGHKAIDLKPIMMGRIIPLKDRRTGRKIFRRVTAKGGWIIPAAKGRPFMDEAASYVEPLFAKAVDDALRAYYERALTP